jgi:AAA family ATP:ADP antiporter
MRTIENLYPEREARTAILSIFFSVLNMVSIGINVVLTPLILNYLGVLAGLLVQPLVLATASYGFYLHPTFISAAIMKISDRGLSYSINRAAKELLYIPVAPVIMYQAKAWIDMVGYRIFKVFGSLLIILLTQWTSWASGYGDLSVVTIVGCIIWGVVLVYLHREYKNLGPVDIAPIKPEGRVR